MNSVSNAVEDYLRENRAELEKAGQLRIHKVRQVRVDQITGLPEERKIYSGRPFEINAKGIILIIEKLENAGQNETLGFHCTLTCVFDAENEKFKISKNSLLVFKER